jgi:MYXO-CTERM domain-containing protein
MSTRVSLASLGSALLIAGALGSTSSAALLFQDSTVRTINNTNYTAHDFGSGSPYQNTVNKDVWIRWTMNNFSTTGTNTSSYFGLHLWNGTSEGLMVGKASGGYFGYSGFCGQKGSFTNPNAATISSSGFSNFALKSGTPDAGHTYQTVRAGDDTTVVMHLWYPGNSAYGAQVDIWLDPDFNADSPWAQTNRHTFLYTPTPFTRIMYRESGTGNGVDFGGLMVGDSAADVGFGVVPAPGALALLGAAGLVGARRRR